MRVLSDEDSDTKFLNDIEFGGDLVLSLIESDGSKTLPLIEAISDEKLLDKVTIVVNGEIEISRRNNSQFEADLQLSSGASNLTFVSGSVELPKISDEKLTLVEELVDDNENDVVIVGVGYREGEPVGIIFGKGVEFEAPSQGSFEFPPSEPEDDPPGFEGGFVTLSPAGSAFTGGTSYSNDDTLSIRGQGFGSVGGVEILIDRQKVSAEIRANDWGQFEADIGLDGLSVGPHELLVRHVDSGDEDLRFIYIPPEDFVSE